MIYNDEIFTLRLFIYHRFRSLTFVYDLSYRFLSIQPRSLTTTPSFGVFSGDLFHATVYKRLLIGECQTTGVAGTFPHNI